MKKISAEFLIKLGLITLALLIALNFVPLKDSIARFFKILQPVFMGIVLALILSGPMDFFQNKVLKRCKHHRLRKTLALVLALTAFTGLISLLFWLVLPASIESIKNLVNQLSDTNYWENIKGTNTFLCFIITQCQTILSHFVITAESYMPFLLNFAKDVLSFIANFLLGIGVCIMLLANRDKLKYQIKRIVKRIFKPKNIETLASVTNMALTKFSRYLGGQVIEAVILGAACYLGMLMLGIPYPALVALLIGFGNLIPIIGAYVGGGVAVIIIFAVNPYKALVFVIFVLILQQVEAWTTYPLVVGKYVGLNGFWIIVSIIIFGGLFGFWGVLLGVPVTAFLHDYIGALTAVKEPKKEVVPKLPTPTNDGG